MKRLNHPFVNVGFVYSASPIRLVAHTIVNFYQFFPCLHSENCGTIWYFAVHFNPFTYSVMLIIRETSV